MRRKIGRITLETISTIRATVKAKDVKAKDVVFPNGDSDAFTVREVYPINEEKVRVTYSDGEEVYYNRNHELRIHLPEAF